MEEAQSWTVRIRHGEIGISKVSDLRTLIPDARPWDFTLRADRRLARGLLDQDDTDWLIGKIYDMNHPKMDQEEMRKAVDQGRTHLNFVVSLYRKQMLKGKHFLHEHPATAASL